MKKFGIMSILFCVLFSISALAAVKKPQNIALDFTLSYKPQASTSLTEHVMKNAVQLADNKWVVAGRMVTNKNNDVLLFLVRMLSHKNNKYKLEFMLIDSGNRSNYITMPRVAAMTGLPVQIAEKEGDSQIQLNVLVNMANKK